MKLTPPKVVTWWIAFILLVLGLLGALGIIGALGTYVIWFLAIGLILLLVACLIKGL